MTVAFDPSSMKAEDTRTLSISFTDYAGVKGALSDQTVNIQNFLFYAQKLYFEAKGGSTGLDDQLLATRGIDAIIPNRFYITNPIIVPPHVRLVAPDGIALGTLSGGALLSSYNGNPATSKVLANVCFPMLMVPHGASTDDIVLYCTNGTQAVSGYAHGKNWVPNGCAVGIGGSGYTAGDILTLPQPSKYPYVATRITVDAVDGNGAVTACSLQTAGVYAVPSGAQARYWTAADGYTGNAGTIANGSRGNVFDGTGNYLTSGGTGSGATISLTWTPDFAGSGADFNRGAVLQADSVIGDVHILQCGQTDDATYGKSFGYANIGLQIYTGKIIVNKGYYGIDIQATDFHPEQLQPISGKIPLSIRNCTSVECPNVVIDTWDVCALDIDNAANIHLKGTIFHNATASVATLEPIQTGRRTSSTNNSNVGMNLDFTVFGGGGSVSTAAAKLAYVRSSRINLDVVNVNRAGTVLTNPITEMAVFGTGYDAESVILSGKMTANVARISSGVTPNSNFDIFDTVGHTKVEPFGRETINALKSSSNLSNAAASGAVWIFSGSGTFAAQQPGPFGLPDAALWTLGTNDLCRQVITASANQRIYVEAYVKNNASTPVVPLSVTNSSSTEYARTLFRTSDGSIFSTQVGGTGAVIRYGSKNVSNGWYHVWMVATVNVANPQVGITQNSGSSGSAFVGPIRAVVAPNVFPPVFVRAPVVTAAVTTSATTIGYSEFDGQLFSVSGVTGSTRFTDLILVSPGRNPVVVVNDTGTGSPATRTYTLDTVTDKGAIKLAMGSGSYAVTLTEKRG